MFGRDDAAGFQGRTGVRVVGLEFGIRKQTPDEISMGPLGPLDH